MDQSCLYSAKERTLSVNCTPLATTVMFPLATYYRVAGRVDRCVQCTLKVSGNIRLAAGVFSRPPEIVKMNHE